MFIFGLTLVTAIHDKVTHYFGAYCGTQYDGELGKERTG